MKKTKVKAKFTLAPKKLSKKQISSLGKKHKPKQNPLLLIANPGVSESDVDLYHKKFRELDGSVTRDETRNALIAHHNQYEALPKTFKRVDVPGLDPKEKFLIEVGKTNQILYTASKHNRKKSPQGFEQPYYHDTNAILCSTVGDKNGSKMLFYIGDKLKMENSGSRKGWLVH